MIAFVKKFWFLILLALLATALAAANFFITQKSVVSPPAPTAPTWKGVTPGVTTTEGLSIFGKPDSTNQEGDKTILGFPREGGGPSHEVVVQNDHVSLIIEKIPGANISTFRQKYGNPEGEYWGPQKDAGFKTYVYPSLGLAVVARPESGVVFEVWYFKPTILEQFLATWGKDLVVKYTKEESF